jgi:hypothetical protein
LFSDSCSVDGLLRLSHLEPATVCERGGRLYGDKGPICKRNTVGFQLGSGENSLDALLDIAQRDVFAICSAIQGVDVQVEGQLSVIIQIDTASEASVPSCGFPGEWLAVLGNAGVGIDVDIYV